MPERREDPVAHELAVLLPGDGRDDPAEDPVAEVRVLERRPGRPGERRARPRAAARRRRARGPAGGRPTGRPSASPADIVSRCRIVTGGRIGRRRRATRRAPGTCVPTGSSRRSRPSSRSSEDRRRRERLRHRRDPVHGVGVGPAAPRRRGSCRRRRRGRATPSRTTPHATPGIRASRLQPLEPGVDGGQEVVERGQPGLPGGSANTRNVEHLAESDRLVQVAAHRARLEDRDGGSLALALADRVAGQRAAEAEPAGLAQGADVVDAHRPVGGEPERARDRPAR